MTELAREDILARADEARVTRVETKNSHVKYKLTLLPMYLSAFKFKNKSYNVLVNGQTGQVGGKAPVSPLRVAIAVLLGIGLIALLYFLFMGADDGETVSYAYDYLSNAVGRLLG